MRPKRIDSAFAGIGDCWPGKKLAVWIILCRKCPAQYSHISICPCVFTPFSLRIHPALSVLFRVEAPCQPASIRIISKKFVSYVFSPSVNELQHNWHYVINAVRILQYKTAILSLAAKLNLKINAESQVFSKFALKRLICATCFWQYPVKIILFFVELLVV